MSDVLDIIKKIGEKETDIQEFISPIFFNEFVTTKIYGIIYKFKISQNVPGWYKIKPTDKFKAKTIRKAKLQEIESYLKCLKKIRLTLVMKKNNIYLAIPEKSNNLGFSIEQMLPIYLFDDTVMDFDKVICRYDGLSLWYHQIDQSNDFSKPTYLREQLLKSNNPENLKFSGLTIEEKIAYTLKLSIDKNFVINRKKEKLKQDVEYAGGKFIKFIEKNDYFIVTYDVDGQIYESTVNKNEHHSVITAGICLSGKDNKYDLKSLITVMREGQNERKIYRL